MKNKYAITVAAVLIFANHLKAQQENIRFEKLSIEQGLSQSSVLAICQDHRGFLWFGTYDGLNRYDGYRFKIYRHDDADSTSLSHNFVRAIFEDHSGSLWIGTEGGLDKFDREQENFVRYKSDGKDSGSISNDRIRDIFEDRQGMLWIATEKGLNRYDREKKIFVKYFHNANDPASISDDLVRAIYEDSSGQLWFGTEGGLNLFDRERGQFSRFRAGLKDPGNAVISSVICMAEDGPGFLWIGTHSGLFRLERKISRITQYQFDPKNPYSLRNNIVRAICRDRMGDLWIGTYGGGLEKYDRAGDRFTHYQFSPNDPHSLSNDAIYCVREDQSGILWIGTDYGGINKFNRRKNRFALYANDPRNPNSLDNNQVHALLEDPADRGSVVWVGTWGGGLNRFDRRNNWWASYKNDPNDRSSLSNNIVRSIYRDRSGTFWVGTDGGLNRFDPKSGKFIRYQNDPQNPYSLSHNMIKTVYEDRAGRLWVGTYGGGLDEYDRTNDRFFHHRYDPKDSTSLSDNIVWCVHEDRSGRLWIGTDAGGLNLFDRASGRFKHYEKNPNDPNSISNNKVLCICEDRTGVLWLGTAGGGLNRFDADQQQFKCYKEQDGLVSNTVQAILEDNQGCLWISTINGLSKFNPTEKKFTAFDMHDGLQSNEFNVGACAKSATGEMFFGGINGFNVFVPELVRRNVFIPPVEITDFQLFNKSVPVDQRIDGRLLLERSITETKEIDLSYRDGVFSFEFTSMDFTAPEKNQYAYMMEGFEKNWNYVGTQRTATYTNLDPGRYVFRVKASNNDGVWNEEGASLEITIAPPFWETAWFRGLGILVVAGMIVGWYKVRTGRMRARNRELERHITERTAQLETANNELEAANKELEAFAYSVSHDLRAPLRAIDGYTNILLEDYEPTLDEEGKRVCTTICNETQRMGQLIDDLLSFSHVSRADMQVAPINMEALASSVYYELTTPESRGRIEFQVGKLPEAVGDATLIREVWMNLLSNAIKFSSKRERAEIEVGYRQEGEKVIYTVKDNGAGFDMRYADKLFTVFWRLHSEKEFEGTGVGLAIVQRLVHRHGGKVWADSQVDKGATFFFTIEGAKR
jgi:ligand-binding sensor domain-containing protein/signal transduction histidine kinase